MVRLLQRESRPRYQGVKTALYPFEDATGFRLAGLEQTSDTLELNHSRKQDTGMPSPQGKVARELRPSGQVTRQLSPSGLVSCNLAVNFERVDHICGSIASDWSI